MNEFRQPCQRCGTWDGVDVYFGFMDKETWLCKACRKKMISGR